MRHLHRRLDLWLVRSSAESRFCRRLIVCLINLLLLLDFESRLFKSILDQVGAYVLIAHELANCLTLLQKTSWLRLQLC